MGDAQTHTAYKRANVSKEVGDKAIEELCEIGIIRVEKSKKIFTSWDEDDGKKVSNKLYFASPFLRFWFAFVSPLFQSVRDGNFDEVRQRFENRQSEFVQLPFAQLSHEFLKLNEKDDKIKEIGTYWDNNLELDIYAKTEDGKVVVGTCKYINSKLKKSVLTNLQESCKNAKIDADIFVIFSKNGFSNELKSLKGDNLKLYTAKSFKLLLN